MPPPPPPPPGGGFVPPPPGGYSPISAGYAAKRTDGLAIASLIIGILSLVCSVACLGIILGPVAAIMGFIARQRVVSSGVRSVAELWLWSAWCWGSSGSS